MPNNAIPIEIKFDENVLRTAKSLGRIQGVFFTLLTLKVCKVIIKRKLEAKENEES